MSETYRILMKTEPGITGDATVKDHKDWIRCESMVTGTSRSGGTTDRRAMGAGEFHGLTLMREPDKASNFLFDQHLKPREGAKFSKVTIDICESGGEVHSQHVLTNAYITEYSLSVDGGGQRETLTISGEEFSLGVTNKDPKKHNFATTSS